MSEMIPDWERADDAHLGTYKGVMRLVFISSVLLVIVLILMAAFLV